MTFSDICTARDFLTAIKHFAWSAEAKNEPVYFRAPTGVLYKVIEVQETSGAIHLFGEAVHPKGGSV